MKLRHSVGHTLAEFSLLCGLIAAAWLLSWGDGRAAATRWLEAWRDWLEATVDWIALG